MGLARPSVCLPFWSNCCANFQFKKSMIELTGRQKPQENLHRVSLQSPPMAISQKHGLRKLRGGDKKWTFN